MRAEQRLARVLIGVLFNHDTIHQVAHSLPTALALARNHPQHRVVLVATTEELAAEVVRLAGSDLDRPNVDFRRLEIRGRIRRASAWAVQPVAPLAKLLLFGEHLDFFRSLDALIVSEKTSLVLKTTYGLDRLRMIHTRHGAGDRSIGFDKASALFDLVLASGHKIARRLIADAGVAPSRIRIVGYPKFDLAPRQPAPFDRLRDSRPIVLYNPHVSPHLSSWYKAGSQILDWFVRNPAYRLIFAPHVMLFRRRLVITIDPPRINWPGILNSRVARAPNIHVDLGSISSTDMTYLEASDYYLGDASSQVYEFLRRPRPCIFFDAHDSPWRDNPSYAHWTAGAVITRPTDLAMTLGQAPIEHPLRYATVQRGLFDETFDLNAKPSAERAASAVADFLAADTRGRSPAFQPMIRIGR